jgi:hypothetical protein
MLKLLVLVSLSIASKLGNKLHGFLRASLNLDNGSFIVIVIPSLLNKVWCSVFVDDDSQIIPVVVAS